jgi:hypothetical protein
LDSTTNFELDETDSEKLKRLAQKAHYQFHDNANEIIANFII